MSSVEDRWFALVTLDDGTTEKRRTERHGRGKRWQVRWREPDGRPRKLSFAKRAEADAHAATVEADKLRGVYIDVRAGQESFGDYARRWLAEQTTDPLTVENIGHRLRRYVEPYPLWRTPLGKVTPSSVQSWLRALDGTGLALSTQGTVFAHISAILNAAVDNEMIAKNPCRAASVRAPRADKRKVVPWTPEWVTGMHDALPERYRVLVTLAAGLGIRQGEAFALSPDDVDWLRGWVTVRRQVKLVANRQVFSLPKGRKVREVPLPASVRDELAAHLAAWPARTVTLPWSTPEGAPTSVPVAVTTRKSTACNRNDFNPQAWKPAQVLAGIPGTRDNGMHALRHYYASVLLDAGESIQALSEYLGHSSAKITLDVYTHLMPASETRTRAAVDAALRSPRAPSASQDARKEV